MSLTGSTSMIRLADGTPAFRKALTGAPEGFFAFEATGLQAMRDLGARVPKVYEVTDDHLLLELIDTAESPRSDREVETAFGQELARLHVAGQRAAAPGQQFGALDGVSHWFLGAARINLNPAPTLYESLVRNRILPLTQQAVSQGLLSGEAVELAQALRPHHLGPEEPPTVVHGDLWAGNRMIDATGANWLIDPSCHWGHREQDIAMMHLFGGFGPAVLHGYEQIFPLPAGWKERIPAFQLVPLLVHVLLFGSGYAASTMRALHATVQERS
ncbi:fructosamine kinase family protein [Enteractinococcus coprophilus]|uniref:Fructosamine-3-kinase n=1 Tax=Enteractinococcus coprophilus TaxID=1027633 RepID=A0A543APL9_9MICC|nr:fructosamine kinase family protein [Enteractinococcus coprophilus]TQL74505.1 fructosamine-3-kinase [Enteractinococcus coprophilus]